MIHVIVFVSVSMSTIVSSLEVFRVVGSFVWKDAQPPCALLRFAAGDFPEGWGASPR